MFQLHGSQTERKLNMLGRVMIIQAPARTELARCISTALNTNRLEQQMDENIGNPIVIQRRYHHDQARG